MIMFGKHSLVCNRNELINGALLVCFYGHNDDVKQTILCAKFYCELKHRKDIDSRSLFPDNSQFLILRQIYRDTVSV